jgi:NADPH:quinone reductase-like Zn-dependent oxidoreductase
MHKIRSSRSSSDQEVEKPIPKDNEILIRILTVVVATEDPLVRKGKPYFGRVLFDFTKPKKPIQGAEFGGEIEAVGKDVKLFKKDDCVFGSAGFNQGCYAEYACVPEEGLLS